MNGLELAKTGVATTVTFRGGVADGETWVVWAAPEIVVVPQSPANLPPDAVKRLDARPRDQVPRHVYALESRGPNNTAVYRLKSMVLS